MADDQSQGQATQQPAQADQGTEANQGSAEGSAGEQASQDASQGGTETAQEQTVEIDGEQVPISQVRAWREGNMRTEDYTRKTQQLAEERRKYARSGAHSASTPVSQQVQEALAKDPQAKAAIEVLKQIGFLTGEDIDKRFQAYATSQEENRALDSLVDANPNLKPYKKAIQAIGQTTGAAWEDIVQDYGFMQKTALQRAKSQAKPIMGTPTQKTQPKEKSISDMTDAEYAAWKQKNRVGNTIFRKVSK